jgi:cell wall-associated NlpC family hydrolase
MQDAPPILRRRRPHHTATAAVALVAVLLGLLAAPAGATPPGFDTGRAASGKAAGGPWTWSTASRAWASSTRVLDPAIVRRGPRQQLTRGQYLNALIRLQRLRGERAALLSRSGRAAPALRDAGAGSPAARAVAAGWFAARNGSFDSRSPVTADEATVATLAALGLRPDVLGFAVRLRTELPGTTGVRWTYASAHALARTLGLRHNVLDPHDEVELGPTEVMNVAHGSFMLQEAADLDSWKLDSARRLARTFDLPDLGSNQLAILGTGARMLGQPYVWAGETEGAQVEGHGGFDCSGFAIRIVNGSGVAAGQIAPVAERTTYTQSALPAAARIAIADLQPADLVFFGDRGPRSTPNQNFHVGVYMGNGWFIHSSGGNGGVAIDALEGWWGQRASWGRRALLAP